MACDGIKAITSSLIFIPEMGMVEMLLKAISHQISVIEVMSVFQGNTEPLKKLQQPLVNFLEDKLLYGAKPTPERKETAVRNFLINCQSSVRAVEVRMIEGRESGGGRGGGRKGERER